MEEVEPVEEITEAGPDLLAQARAMIEPYSASFMGLDLWQQIATIVAIASVFGWALRIFTYPSRRAKRRRLEEDTERRIRKAEERALKAEAQRVELLTRAKDAETRELKAEDKINQLEKQLKELRGEMGEVGDGVQFIIENLVAREAHLSASQDVKAHRQERRTKESPGADSLREEDDIEVSLSASVPPDDAVELETWREAVTAVAADLEDKAAAQERFTEGDYTDFEDLFARAGEDKSATFWIAIGDLAYVNHTQRALEAYREALALDTSSAHAWNQMGLLERRLGNLSEAETAFTHVLEAAGINDEQQVAALSNLGLVATMRGDLNTAEDYFLRGLAMDEELGRTEGMAAKFGNLGNIAKQRGDLDKAKDYHQRSLAIETELGRKEGIAAELSNLGNIAQTRGAIDEAEDYYRQSLALAEELGSRELQAMQLANLGFIAQSRGDLDKADENFLRGLAIYEKLDRKQGVAINLANLGVVANARGDTPEACRLWGESLALFEEIGMRLQIEQVKDLMREARCGEDA